MQTSPSKFSSINDELLEQAKQILAQHRETEAFCRRQIRVFWKDRDMVMVIAQTLNSTLYLIRKYENEIKDRSS